MRRLVPYPVLATGLLIMWLLLNQSIAASQLVLGAVVAIAACHAMAALRPQPVRIRTLRPAPRLAAAVLVDIVRSNMAVAKILLSPARPDRVSGFVRLPLAMTNQYGLAILACIITATPGTLWVQFDRRTGELLVHILDVVDEQAWIRLIKHRYEQALMEIFE
ncbi:cation:proton antiporter [Sphingomonas sp. DBB INV C78]|uniref:Na+/H+ antiporter subunit E n=1 Tax=Sphingomonas sp. DBB INV C78 TaxID=3349434 RepID=UPI0036D26A0F